MCVNGRLAPPPPTVPLPLCGGRRGCLGTEFDLVVLIVVLLLLPEIHLCNMQQTQPDRNTPSELCKQTTDGYFCPFLCPQILAATACWRYISLSYACDYPLRPFISRSVEDWTELRICGPTLWIVDAVHFLLSSKWFVVFRYSGLQIHLVLTCCLFSLERDNKTSCRWLGNPPALGFSCVLTLSQCLIFPCAISMFLPGQLNLLDLRFPNMTWRWTSIFLFILIQNAELKQTVSQLF